LGTDRRVKGDVRGCERGLAVDQRLAAGDQLALEAELPGGVLLVASLVDDLSVPGLGESITLWIDPEQIILCSL
jgi:molybdate transport system regulatory protein